MEDVFWSIVEKAGSPTTLDPETQCEAISESLRSCSKEEIIAFANTHQHLLAKLDNWKMLKASFVVLGYASDDVFEDFRNWIILHGKEKYFETLSNPEFLAEYAEVYDPVEEISGEPLLYVCEAAWGGDIGELEEEFDFPSPSKYEMEWPAKKQLALEYPKLAARFNFGGEGLA